MNSTSMPSKKVVLVRKIDKKNGYIIPIEKVNEIYITGQDLTYDKMIGKVPLTEEEKRKYPHVINPHSLLRIRDHKKLDVENDAYDKALYDLMIASRTIAKSKSHFDKDPIQYVGYIFDMEEDAKATIQKEDAIYTAMTLIRDLPVDSYKPTVLLMNHMVKNKFYIPPTGVSLELQKAKMLEACRQYPEAVKNCFPAYNPGIERYGFVLELIEYKIIKESGRGELFYEKELLGSSVDQVLSYLDKEPNSHMKRVFAHRLQVAKGLVTQEKIDVVLESDFIADVNYLKALILDDDAGSFKEKYPVFVTKYSMYVSQDKYIRDMAVLSKYMHKISSSSERESFKISLEERDLESLHRAFTVKSPYVREEAEEFWEDKEKLIEYMVNKKIPNA